ARVLAAEAQLTQGGGCVLRPASLLEPDRPFLSPGLIDVTGVGERTDDEIFGPLLQLVRVETFEAGVEEAGRTRFGLAAGLISDDEALYRRVWRAPGARGVYWNRAPT